MQLIKRLKRIYWIYRFINIRGLLTVFRFKKISNEVRIKSHCSFRNLKYMKSGCRLVINEYAQIFINKIDKNMSPILEIGDNVSIGRFSSIGCSHHIVLEDWVRLAPHVHITDRNHKYEDISTPITLQPIKVGKVHIKAHTWLGYGAQVMPGVTIGKHCVIAAGSIVTKDVPDYSVAAGIPAKVVKQYSFTDKKWISSTKALDSNSTQARGGVKC